MFKQMKSALFWYYLYKFRRRVLLILMLLVIALFANAIYGDVVEYLKLKEQLQYLELALILKWVVILFSVTCSLYLILTLFKKHEDEKNKTTKKEENNKKETVISAETLSQRERSFLHKKPLRNKADVLLQE